jgi:hypothetical protein
MISQSGAYSRLVRPAPYFGIRKEQVPEARRQSLGVQLLNDLGGRPPVARDLVGKALLLRVDSFSHKPARVLILHEPPNPLASSNLLPCPPCRRLLTLK